MVPSVSENQPTLASLLENKRSHLMSIFSEEAVKGIKASNERLSSTFNDKKSELMIGDKVPMFSLKNSTNEEVSLEKILEENKFVVLTWYRGAWCPYCNVALHSLIQVNDKIKQLGGKLVALSPELPDESLSLKEKLDLPFEVLSDIRCEVAEKYGVAFTVDQGTMDTYVGLGIDLQSINANDRNKLPKLPVPATFVLDKNGQIIYRFIEFDYTQRAELEDILKAIKSM